MLGNVNAKSISGRVRVDHEVGYHLCICYPPNAFRPQMHMDATKCIWGGLQMHLGMKKWDPYAFGAHLNAFGDGMHLEGSIYIALYYTDVLLLCIDCLTHLLLHR